MIRWLKQAKKAGGNIREGFKGKRVAGSRVRQVGSFVGSGKELEEGRII